MRTSRLLSTIRWDVMPGHRSDPPSPDRDGVSGREGDSAKPDYRPMEKRDQARLGGVEGLLSSHVLSLIPRRS